MKRRKGSIFTGQIAQIREIQGHSGLKSCALAYRNLPGLRQICDFRPYEAFLRPQINHSLTGIGQTCGMVIYRRVRATFYPWLFIASLARSAAISFGMP